MGEKTERDRLRWRALVGLLLVPLGGASLGGACGEGAVGEESLSVCATENRCAESGDVERTTGITQDRVGYRFVDGSLEIPAAVVGDVSGISPRDVGIQVFAAKAFRLAPARLAATLHPGTCGEEPCGGPIRTEVAVFDEYGWVSVFHGTNTSAEAFGTDAKLVLEGENVDVAELEAFSLGGGCSAAPRLR